ncbi:MAG: putative glutamine amidotransferase [Phycisphaerales bacterium]|nr:putative glutamine amidotransferase [Phycisphaerales bacterium]MEA2735709.1 putative glutamine amidotransferase [Humisphaera sp.]
MKIVNTTQYLFCYGTLLRDAAPKSLALLCRRLHRLCTASVTGQLYDLGSYPGLVLGGEDATTIRGEIVAVRSASDWLRLDAYEGADSSQPDRSLFNRVRTMVTTDAGERVECWIYVYNRDLTHAARIDSGCWRTYLADGEEFVAVPC